MYLEDDSIEVDNETAVKLGCLELRRFYKDMPQIALKKKENFTILEREIGLEKFFKQSLLNSVKRRNLRTMVQNAFQQYESLTMEGCVFQFFNLLSKFHAIDVERFTNCAVGVRTGGQGGEKGGIGEILLAAIPLKVDACAAFPNTASSSLAVCFPHLCLCAVCSGPAHCWCCIRACNESCGTAVGMLRTSYLCTETEYEQPVQSHKHQQHVFTLYLPPTHVRTQDDQALPLTSDIFVGPNCNVEYQQDGGERRFLAAFNDIQDISYEVELMSRGRVILDMTNSPVSGSCDCSCDNSMPEGLTLKWRGIMYDFSVRSSPVPAM